MNSKLRIPLCWKDGAVVRPGTYEVKSGEMLGDMLRAAGGFRPEAQLNRISLYRLRSAAERGPGAPPRAVIDISLSPEIQRLHHSSPASPAADPVSGVVIPDLVLQDGDEIDVDEVRPLEGQFYVAIAGQVHKPGRYPWHEGMTLRDLVLLGRGPRVGAYLREAEIARMPVNRAKGELAQTLRVPLDSSYLLERDSSGRYYGPPGVSVPANGTPEVTLQPYDNVLILREPDFELQRSVRITGEVEFPGTYSLRAKDERLANIIARAGGLTPEAYSEGVRFIRHVNNVGRVDVNLAEALKTPQSSHNIVLQPGDSIDIPEYEPSVRVVGAVNSPGSVLWQKGNGLDYYLSAAGGASYKADKGRTSVRYANGEVRTRHKTLWFSSFPTPGPGSEIFVPVRDTTRGTNLIALFGSIAQVMASVLTIALVATKL